MFLRVLYECGEFRIDLKIEKTALDFRALLSIIEKFVLAEVCALWVPLHLHFYNQPWLSVYVLKKKKKLKKLINSILAYVLFLIMTISTFYLYLSVLKNAAKKEKKKE